MPDRNAILLLVLRGGTIDFITFVPIGEIKMQLFVRMAPEVIDPALMYAKPVDVWSFGVMAREVWEGEPPYMDESQTKALFLIMSKGLPPLDYKRPGAVDRSRRAHIGARSHRSTTLDYMCI
jgi:hypothetical protein